MRTQLVQARNNLVGRRGYGFDSYPRHYGGGKIYLGRTCGNSFQGPLPAGPSQWGRGVLSHPMDFLYTYGDRWGIHPGRRCRISLKGIGGTTRCVRIGNCTLLRVSVVCVVSWELSDLAPVVYL